MSDYASLSSQDLFWQTEAAVQDSEEFFNGLAELERRLEALEEEHAHGSAGEADRRELEKLASWIAQIRGRA